MAGLMRGDNTATKKKAIVAFIDEIAPEWKDLSRRIHDHPELGLKEEQASRWLAEGLERRGFVVKRNVAKLPTAFVGRAGGAKAKPSIAFLAEYDSMQGLGHADRQHLIG